MRQVGKLWALACCALALAGLPAQARDWKAIKQSGTIQGVTEGQYAPFNFYEGSKLTGFEVELAEALAKKMGLKLEWHAVAFDAQLAAIAQDRFDFAIASHGYSEERAKAVDFANPHYCSGGQIAALPGGPLSAAALKGKTVAVQIATSYYEAAKKIPGVGDIKTYKDDATAFAAFRSKKVDAWISDRFVIKSTLDQNPNSGAKTGDMVFVERIAMITRKNNKELLDQWNAALAAAIKDGTYKALSDKYFKSDIACH